MSKYNFNFGGITNGVFKMPDVSASNRTRATHYNTTQNTFNPTLMNENFDSSTSDLKMIEQRLDILKLMCQPAEMQKIEADLGRHLAEANRLLGDICCQKFGERLLGTNTQPFPVGISCAHSINLRNVSRTQTTDNHFGLLNPPTSGYVTNTRRTINSHQGFTDNTVESVCSRVPKNPTSLVDNTAESVRSRVSRKPTSSVKNKNQEISEPSVFIVPPVRSRMPKKLAPSKKRKTDDISEPRISAVPSRKLTRANESGPSVVKKPLNAPKLKELEVLPSDDDDDILCILKKMSSKVIKKKKNETDEEPSKPQDEISEVSSRLDDTDCSYTETIVTRARKPRQAKAATSLENRTKNSDRSPGPTLNSSPLKARNESQAVRKTKKKDVEKGCTDAARRKKPSKSNNVDAKIGNTKKEEKISHKASETNDVSGFEELDERSFFSNISSIGGDSLQIEDPNTGKKVNRSNDHRQYDLPSGFLSPLANARSTSGFSAISTPLSKTAMKNALNKRLKRPNVAAELKDQLSKKRRKPRTTNIVPVDDPIKSSDSELESTDPVSDFSD